MRTKKLLVYKSRRARSVESVYYWSSPDTDYLLKHPLLNKDFFTWNFHHILLLLYWSYAPHSNFILPTKLLHYYIAAIITDVIDKVREAIPDADQVEYLGSSYEGNATKNNSDFDVTVNIAPKGSRFQVENIPDELGYVKLRYLSGGTTEFNSKCIKGGYLSSKAVMQKIVSGYLPRLLNFCKT